MSEQYIVSLAIGPVQDFIAAALRTRDLWMGSWMLSEVSKAAARGMQQARAELIFPAVKGGEDLEEGSSLNVSNRVVAMVKGNSERAKQVLEQGEQAARKRWAGLVDEAMNEYARLVKGLSLREELVNLQREDMLEFFGTWVGGNDDDYLKARRQLDALTAARKNTRDFLPAASRAQEPPFFGLPKSSLDARRETVLPEGISVSQRRKLRLGEGEQLDVAGLVKRLAANDMSEQFTPVSRIAADDWIERLELGERGSLAKTWEQARHTLGAEWMTRVKGNGQTYAAFPHDGNLLFPGQLSSALRLVEHEDQKRALRQLSKVLRPLYQSQGEPSGYYALLMADGDRMGQLLDKAKNADEHRKISRTLSSFAEGVAETVRQHRGHCIYAGGDDVLALIPMSQVVDCADELRQNFVSVFEKAGLCDGDDCPTFSVGVAIAHIMEPLGRVRSWAMAAEKAAKNGLRDTERRKRNALAIFLHTRSGVPLRWRSRWDDEEHEDVKRWQQYFATTQLSAKLPYELRDLLIELGVHSDDQDPPDGALQALLHAEVRRILKRKQPDGTQLCAELQDKLEQDFSKRAGNPFHWVNGLLLARWLAGQERIRS